MRRLSEAQMPTVVAAITTIVELPLVTLSRAIFWAARQSEGAGLIENPFQLLSAGMVLVISIFLSPLFDLRLFRPADFVGRRRTVGHGLVHEIEGLGRVLLLDDMRHVRQGGVGRINVVLREPGLKE
jgi:hypothetical protein